MSKPTVSRVLNGHRDVAEATRRRVQDVAAEMGYTPSADARALRTGRHGAIGLLMPPDYWWGFGEVQYGIAREAARNQPPLPETPEAEEEFAKRTLPGLPVDGLIPLMPYGMLRHIGDLARSGTPVAVIDDRGYRPGIPFVETTNREGMRAMGDTSPPPAGPGSPSSPAARTPPSPSPASRATWTHSARPASSTGLSWSGLAAALDAGLDQFGGDDCTEHIVELVRSGQVSEERVDVSARRLLREKFRLGLFENRHVDPGHASQLCGSRPLRAADRAAQSDYTVLVKNDVQSLDHVDRTVEEATPFFREHLAARGTPSGHRRAPLHRSEGTDLRLREVLPGFAAGCEVYTRTGVLAAPELLERGFRRVLLRRRIPRNSLGAVGRSLPTAGTPHRETVGCPRPDVCHEHHRTPQNTTEHPRACTPVSYTNRTSG